MVRPAPHVRQLVVEARGRHHTPLRPGQQGLDAGRLLPQRQRRQVPHDHGAQPTRAHSSRRPRSVQSAADTAARVSHEAAEVPARQPDLHHQHRQL